MRKTLAMTSLLMFSFAADAGAVQYQFSGAQCQPEKLSDVNLTETNGGGIGNTDTTAFPSAGIVVVCPVSGLESATQTQTELKARVYDGNGGGSGDFYGFWQLDSMSNGTIWWSSIKHTCATTGGCAAASPGFTGGTYLTWSGAELLGAVSSFTTYSFRAVVPGRRYDTITYPMSQVRAYWTTHNER